MTVQSSLAGTAAAVGVALCSVGIALADEFPERPIHITVVWPAGGGHDIAGRMIGQELSEILDVAVVIDNVTGAGGSTGMRHLASADPDGYTIGIMGMHAIAQSFMNPNAPDLDSVTPLAYIADDPGALQAVASTGIDSVAAYVEAMRADPSALVNGNDPQGGNSFIFANLIADALDVDMQQIPYQGHAPNVTALVNEEIQTATLPIPPVLEHARAGTVNILAVMSQERHPLLPDVPTFIEEGYDLVSRDFLMVVGPAGIPDDTQARLEDALVEAIESDSFREIAERNGMVLRPGGAELAQQELSEQIETVYPLLLDAGMVHESLER